MELPAAIVAFLLLVVLVAVVGVALGRAMAPRLSAWDDARARATDEATGADAGDGEAELGDEGDRHGD